MVDHEWCRIRTTLNRALERLTFPAPVACVYNPLDYAGAMYDEYCRRYGEGPKRYLLVGMNPGPWGMMQTGVPFGAVGAVRDWLKIDAPIRMPPRCHPRRPVQGCACRREEVSGARLWGWAREHFVTPRRFFKDFFVANYCPLAFLDEAGRNITPDKLPRSTTSALYAACDDGLRAIVRRLEPQYVVGVGAFAEVRARAALADGNIAIARVPHPSPASPAANRGWAAQMTNHMRRIGFGPAREECTLR